MLTPSSPHGMVAADCIFAALEDYEPRDQFAGLGWAVVGVLGALRERFEQTPAERDAFDGLCTETQARLRREIEALRFTKAH